MAKVQRNVCLIVIDGWGISESKEGISISKTNDLFFSNLQISILIGYLTIFNITARFGTTG